MKNLSIKNPTQFFLLCGFLAIGYFLPAQSTFSENWREKGQSMSTSFTSEDYQANGQTWSIVQDPRGIMYIGNGGGLLEYDGTTWEHIELPGGGAYGLAIDSENRIFVGSANDMGYLAPEPDGTLAYTSLAERLPQAARQPVLILQVLAVGKRVYFSGGVSSGTLLFEWQGGTLESAAPEDSLKYWSMKHGTTFSSHNGHLYASARGWGLHRLENGAWVRKLDIQEDVPLIMPWNVQAEGEDSRLLLGHSQMGAANEPSFFHLFDPNTENLQPLTISPVISSAIQEFGLFKGGNAGNDQFALILNHKVGGIIMDTEGNCIQGLSKERGLVDQSIRRVLEDNRSGLWVSTDDGISRLELRSPISWFPGETSFNGTAYFFKKHQGRTYLGTTTGLYRMILPESPTQLATFKQIEGVNLGNCLYADGEQLLVGSNDGIHLLKGDRTSRLGPPLPNVRVLFCPAKNPDILFAACNVGTYAFAKINGTYRYAGRLEKESSYTISMVENKPDELWSGSFIGKAIRIRLSPASYLAIREQAAGKAPHTDIPIELDIFDQQDSLPGGIVETAIIDNQLVFATSAGLRKFDEQTSRFLPETAFGQELSEHVFTFRLVQSPGGRITVLAVREVETRPEIAIAEKDASGKYQVHFTRFNRIKPAQTVGMQFIYPDPEYPEVVWMGGGAGLFRYDAALEKDAQERFPAFVRRVSARGDSTIFGGTASYPGFVWKKPELTYSLNSLRFEFSSPAYELPEENTYQYRLTGFEKNWSDWTKETFRDYTNLSEGSYRFVVRAKNIFNEISEEGSFEFTILPPWYRSWWAFGLYGLLILLTVGLIVFLYNRWRMRQLQARNRELEQTVKERTEEIREKNVQLQSTLKHLRSTQDQLIIQEKMASLGQMTAGIAHEIKNPLNFVTNFAEGTDELMAEFREDLEAFKGSQAQEDYQNLLETLDDIVKYNQDILANGKRADQIVNSMMNHAHDQQGEKVQTDLNYLLPSQLTLAQHGYLPQQEGFQVEIIQDFDPDMPEVTLNPQELGRVMINLVNNACYALEQKQQSVGDGFNPTIHVSSRLIDGQVEIRVRDNGPGIPEEIRKQIFQPFFTTKPTGKGNTGLGLSISYDIVRQGLQGQLTVESEVGEFTEFILSFPIK